MNSSPILALKLADAKVDRKPLVQTELKETKLVLEGFDGVTYTLGGGAKVHHLWSTARTLAKADNLLKLYQEKESSGFSTATRCLRTGVGRASPSFALGTR